MNVIGFLAICLFTAAAPFARSAATAAPEVNAAAESDKPAPQIVEFEKLLAQKQAARDEGALPPKEYQEFASQFRADLEALMSRVSPSSVNQGQYNLILSRLDASNRAAALVNLAQALETSPGDPELLRVQGQVLYEQRDFPAAAESARKAWESSGRRNKAAWALLKMSEGRAAGTQSSSLAAVAASSAATRGVDWSIPADSDISPQAMVRMRKAVALRKRGDLGAAWTEAQAVMNAEPTSKGVQKFYEVVRAERVQALETQAFIENAVRALGAGRGEEAVAWAVKANQRSPGEATSAVLADVRRRSAEIKTPTPAEVVEAKAINSTNFLGGFLHYVGASSKPRRVKFSDIDTSAVRVEDFAAVTTELRKPARNEQVKIRAPRAGSTSGAQGLLVGNFTLLLKGTFTHYDDCRWEFDGSLRAFDDKYDFNEGPRKLVAETLTMIGRKTPGKPYSLEIRGVRRMTASGIKENCK